MFAAINLFVLVVLTIAVCEQTEQIREVVVEAFAATHDGYSSDEVILNDELNSKFIAVCRERMPDCDPFQCNWTLINLRKAGKLKSIETTKRQNVSTDDYVHVAEIVSRSLIDRHGVSIDRIMSNPKTRGEFDQRVRTYNENVDPYLVRKAAFQLRKTRRLKPELITRIADWGRLIKIFSVDEFRADNKLADEKPGIYIFHDKSGYLYIGQSDDLRRRLKTHLDESSNHALGNYLNDDSSEIRIEIHEFPVDSRAKEVMIRRAYESELIRVRKPRFNILP